MQFSACQFMLYKDIIEGGSIELNKPNNNDGIDSPNGNNSLKSAKPTIKRQSQIENKNDSSCSSDSDISEDF